MGGFVTVSKIQVKPGVVKDDTALQSEGTFTDSNMMRGRRGQMETIGGCQLFLTETLSEADGSRSRPRGAYAWTDLSGNPLAVCGSASKLYAFLGGAKLDITPPHSAGVLRNPFTTVSGSPTVTVTHPLHGLASGNTVTYTNPTPVGGLTLNGTYVVSVLNPNSYTITAGSNATSSVTAGVTQTATRTQGTNVKTLTNPFSTVSGSTTVTVRDPAHGFANGTSVTFSGAPTVAGLNLNNTYTIAGVTTDTYTITAGSAANATVTPGNTGTVDFVAPFVAGNVDALALGYGTGPYSSGPYGASTMTDTDPRIWSLANFGENLLAVPRDGALYEWQPAFSAPEIVLNGGFDSDTQWAKGSGWTISGGKATKAAGSPSTLSQNIVNAVTAGKVYRVTFAVTVTAGTLKFQINAGSPTAALIDVNGSSGAGASTPISTSGTYTRTFRMPANAVDLAFSADAAFAGDVDVVSVKLETKAYRIDEAPRNIGYMFVPPERFVVLIATQQADGTYNPRLVRWSDQENNRIWVPDANNLAGELTLEIGGTALAGRVARQQNVIWTGSGLSTLTFTGDADTVFTFKTIGTGAGLIGRHAHAEQGGIVFWVSRSGFYIFQGAIAQKIDNPNERDFFDNLAPGQEEKIFAGVNPAFSEIWFCYPDKRDGPNGNDGTECSRVWVYNFIEQHWVPHKFDRTSWIASGIFRNPIGFSASGLVYEHEVGHDLNGNPLNAYAKMAPLDAEDGDRHMILKAIYPDFDDQIGSVAFDVTPRLSQRGADLQTTTRTASPTDTVLRMRCKGRQHDVTIRTVGAPSFFRIGALRLDVEKGAARR